MRGRVCHVNQGELLGGGLVKVSQPGSSQSTHSSREVPETEWSQGVQEGGCAVVRPNEGKPAGVSPCRGTRQAGGTQARQWEWVERSVWTQRMLEVYFRGL